jgi:isopentenyl diphosphate isomerase/L-lactate dehydrogenase-like FMN-dependent dehydrogenase
VFDYFASGADDEITLHNNRSAFSKLYLSPHSLTGVSHIDIHTQILGHRLQKPFGFAPSAMQRLAHPGGEMISAKVAYEEGICLTLSTLSTVSLTESSSSGQFSQLIQCQRSSILANVH